MPSTADVARAPPPSAVPCPLGFLFHRWDRAKHCHKRARPTLAAGAAGPGMPPRQRSIGPNTVRLSDLRLLGPTKASNPLLCPIEIRGASIAPV